MIAPRSLPACLAACILLCWPASPLFAQDAAASGATEPVAQDLTLEQLLEAVRGGRIEDQAEDRRRLQRFRSERSAQQKLLQDIRERRAELEARSAAMETEYEDNDRAIGELEERLQERMGSLKELFGVLQQVASDAQGRFYVSLTQLEHPERIDFLVDFAGRMGQANRLPAIEEIEQLWFELQREMTLSGQVVTRRGTVVSGEGIEEQRPVTRIGLFNAVSEGEYLQFIPETQRLVAFGRQPDGRYLAGLEALAEGNDELVPVAIDPVRGQLLEILTQAPDLRERIGQGGAIGYVIIGLGIIGVLLALWRLATLYNETRVIHRQLKRTDAPSADNAIGRILLAAREEELPKGGDTVPGRAARRESDVVEALELRLGEAVLAEVPRLNRFIPLLKIIAAVAPLIGLLGTVTGMIVTFQAITLFGAGDPKLMAGGISQALITTVLGLCVAVPMLLLHNLVAGRAQAITEMLQQRAVALVAARAEERLQAPRSST